MGVWLAATIVAAIVGLISEMTALQDRSAIRVFPIVLVVEIVVAVPLAPLVAGEASVVERSWRWRRWSR